MVGECICRPIPSVTKGVEHHELSQKIVRVVTAWENTAPVIDCCITAVVQRLNISTTTSLISQTVVKTHSTTASISCDVVACIYVDHCPANLTKETSTSGNNLVTSTYWDTNRVLSGVQTTASSTSSCSRSIQTTGSNQHIVRINRVCIAVPSITPAVRHIDENHGLIRIRTSVKETRAVI